MNTKKTDAVKQRESSKRKKAPTPASWRPGQSGNPAGRPPIGNSLAEVFRTYLDGSVTQGRTRKELLVERLFKLTDGTSSAVAAARLLVDTVAAFELEERLTRLEERVETVLAGDHRGR